MQALRAAAASRIAKQTDGIPPEKVEKIVLYGVAITTEMLLPFTRLSQLILVSMKPAIKSLHTLLEEHSWTNLVLLDVSDNHISISSAFQTKIPSLRRLLISNNSIKDMTEVKYLAEAFPELEVLDLSFNAVSTEENFNNIFNLFPKLVALDSRRQDGEEVIVQDIDESDSEVTTSSEDEEDEEEEEEDNGGKDEKDSKCSSSNPSHISDSDKEESDDNTTESQSNENMDNHTKLCPPAKRVKRE